MRRPLVIIGPSGSGKSSLVDGLVRRGLVTVTPTWTTRPRRSDEHTGSANHVFVDGARFDAVDRSGGFLGVATLFGHRYGLPPLADSTGTVPTVVARVGALDLVRRHLPDPVVVQVEASPARIRSALAARGTDPVEAGARLRAGYEELVVGRCVADHVVVNDGTLDDLIARVGALVTGEAVAA